MCQCTGKLGITRHPQKEIVSLHLFVSPQLGSELFKFYSRSFYHCQKLRPNRLQSTGFFNINITIFTRCLRAPRWAWFSWARLDTYSSNLTYSYDSWTKTFSIKHFNHPLGFTNQEWKNTAYWYTIYSTNWPVHSHTIHPSIHPFIKH